MRRIAVIGLGNFGYHLCTSLAKNGAEVLAIDRDYDLVEQIKNDVTRSICLDTTSEKNLQATALQEMDAVIITIGENYIEHSILTTSLVAGLGVPLLIARSTSDLHGRILKLVGAQEVINPEQFIADRLSKRVTKPSIVELIQLSDDGYALSDILVPPTFVDKTLAELNLRQEYSVNVIAIKHKHRKILPDGTEQIKDSVNHLPKPNDLLRKNDIISCIGAIEQIEKIAALGDE